MTAPDLSHAILTEMEGETLALLPERGAFHPRTGTLYIADLHIGKSATFRAVGIPVPDGDTELDLARLSKALFRTDARRLVVLGDFLHAEPGQRDQNWGLWREQHQDVEVLVVRGNHDVSAGDAPAIWGIRLVDEPFADGPFVLRHHPEIDHGGLVLAGHLHPAVRLKGLGRDRISLPCFHFSRRLGILPAFTTFAGGYPVQAREGDRVYAVADQTVMDVTAIAISSRGRA